MANGKSVEHDENDEDYNDSNAFMLWVAQIQKGVTDFYKKYRRPILLGVLGIFLVLYFAFLLYGLILYWNRAYPLLIFTIITAFAFLYYLILKPKLGKKVEENCWGIIKYNIARIYSINYVRW